MVTVNPVDITHVRELCGGAFAFLRWVAVDSLEERWVATARPRTCCRAKSDTAQVPVPRNPPRCLERAAAEAACEGAG